MSAKPRPLSEKSTSSATSRSPILGRVFPFIYCHRRRYLRDASTYPLPVNLSEVNRHNIRTHRYDSIHKIESLGMTATQCAIISLQFSISEPDRYSEIGSRPIAILSGLMRRKSEDVVIKPRTHKAPTRGKRRANALSHCQEACL